MIFKAQAICTTQANAFIFTHIHRQNPRTKRLSTKQLRGLQQNALKLQWCIKHSGTIVLCNKLCVSTKEELDNVNPLAVTKRHKFPLLSSGRIHRRKKGGESAACKEKLCCTLSSKNDIIIKCCVAVLGIIHMLCVIQISALHTPYWTLHCCSLFNTLVERLKHTDQFVSAPAHDSWIKSGRAWVYLTWNAYAHLSRSPPLESVTRILEGLSCGHPLSHSPLGLC